MADDTQNPKLFPIALPQNPAQVEPQGQEFKTAVRAQVENILADFLQLLPDNYISQVPGPYYIMQFQAMAEQLAEIQLVAQEVYEDADYDYTRSEFLFQILGALIFPDGAAEGIPVIEGDITYRDFLRCMVLLILRGATPDVIKEGIELLTDSDITLLEKSVLSRNNPLSAWGFDEQFEFEVNVSTDNGTAFPAENPFILERNVELVMRVLKPAHTLFEYRHLFIETFGEVFSDVPTFDIETYHYDDLRKFCQGAKNITSSSGETLTDRFLFSDVTREFDSICVDADLVIESGVNEGVYRVVEVLDFPVGDDTTARAYTTSPTGLAGTATVSGSEVEDPSQDFAQAVEGETFTFTEGPNMGSYRFKSVGGNNGGPVGFASGPSTTARVAPSMFRLKTRMPVEDMGQTYRVVVDRLGVRVPQVVTGEDASSFFIL